ERARKLGAMREPDLQAATDALARPILRLKKKNQENRNPGKDFLFIPGFMASKFPFFIGR
ncbi:MAG TPA: hypothetical protein VFA58_02540, partial [Chthoniobacterales bacterium]|nr:hypothetical protein [Chthoniobacterales bacterium]